MGLINEITYILTKSTIVTFDGSAEVPNVIVMRLSACSDSSLVKGTSNHRLRVAVIDTLRPNTCWHTIKGSHLPNNW